MHLSLRSLHLGFPLIPCTKTLLLDLLLEAGGDLERVCGGDARSPHGGAVVSASVSASVGASVGASVSASVSASVGAGGAAALGGTLGGTLGEDR